MKIETDSLFKELHELGLRLTPQRIAIVRYIFESQDHLTAQQIYEALKPQFLSLSLATVYNTLDLLMKLGKVNVLGHIGDDIVHYDANTLPHVNLGCVKCKKIEDVPSELAGHMSDEISLASGYTLLGSRILFYGICKSCQLEQELLTQ